MADHNSSPQTGVARNNDPALDVANEHHHAHLHHSERTANANSNVVYSFGTTDERISPHLDKTPHDVPHRDPSAELEKGVVKDKLTYHDSERSDLSHDAEEAGKPKGKISRFYAKYRIWFHLVILKIFTGWWIQGLIRHHHDMNWIKPFLFWLAIALRIITLHVPLASWIMKALRFSWKSTAHPIKQAIPEKMRTPAAAALVVAVYLVGSFASEETVDNTRANRAVSMFGLIVFTALLYATSRNRKKIVWQTVIVGYLVQFIVALFVLRTKAGYDIFAFVSEMARDLLGFAKQGLAFLTSDSAANETPWFMVNVLPAILFFVAFVQLLYHLGFIQWFIGKFAVFFFWSMRVSGAEAVVAAASPFIGQGESAMLVKPFVNHMTMAEIHQIMASGFATISGSVLVAYLSMGISGQALISSCVMSIPAALAYSKLRYPEEEETLTSGRVVIPDDEEHRASNALHAFANGAWLGLKIAAVIAATLLCIIALVGLVDGILTWWGRYLDLDGDYDLTLELILGYVCFPIAWLLGVGQNKHDLLEVGRIIGTKIIINEFVAFSNLQSIPMEGEGSISGRARLIATYAVCGFGNIGSLGNQIGMLMQIAPSRTGDVSRVAVSALLTGILATLSSAGIAGMIVTDSTQFTVMPTA